MEGISLVARIIISYPSMCSMLITINCRARSRDGVRNEVLSSALPLKTYKEEMVLELFYLLL